MRSVSALVMASVSIGSGVYLHGYTQTNNVGPAGFAQLISRSPLGSLLGTGKHRASLNAVLRAKHGRLARLRAALGLGRIHPKWANPAALVVILGGVGSSILMLFRSFMMRRRSRKMMQGALPPEVLRMLGQMRKGSDQPW
jgi:hypothetical protein